MWLFGPPNVEKMEANRDVKGLIKVLGYRKSGWVRGSAAHALGRIGDARAVEPLCAALKDSDSNVSGAAIDALEKIGDARAVEPLVVALKYADRHWRAAAAHALVKIGPPAVEAFGAMLKDSDWDRRKVAAGALVQIGRASVELLIATLQLKDSDWNVCGRAADALGKIGDARAVEPLVAALKDKSSYVRKAAAEALDAIGWRPGQDESGVAYWVAKQKWDKCIEIGAPSVEPLIARLRDSDSKSRSKDDADVRIAVAGALEQIGDARATEPLISELKDIDRDVRFAAACALARFGYAGAIEPLIDALKSGHWPVRQAAAKSLVKLYQSGLLDKEHASLVLAQRGRISASHNDQVEHHSDFNSCGYPVFGNDRHTDDGGIGVSFPV